MQVYFKYVNCYESPCKFVYFDFDQLHDNYNFVYINLDQFGNLRVLLWCIITSYNKFSSQVFCEYQINRDNV